MHIATISRILGLLILGLGITFLPPLGVALFLKEEAALSFISSALATLVLGSILWLPNRLQQGDIRAREGFLIVTLIWVILSLISSLPFLLIASPKITFVDALFETISGLTTTGASIITQLDTLPRSILYYRQQLQFVGGGGIIVFGIAILPLLGVGGMQLFRAEFTTPFKEEKLTPRIAHTAKALWGIYSLLAILCTLGYWAAGMNLFDAVCHSFSTISTGGFSTYDDSLAHFQNVRIELVAIFFMILGAINFSLHFITIRHGGVQQYWQDRECRAFLILILIITLIVCFMLINEGTTSRLGIFADSLFQVTTFFTTTGLVSTNYSIWPSFVPILLMVICLIGGCAGSTAGGIKMIRVILMNKHSFREIERLIHPSGHYVIKLGYSRLTQRTLDAVWGFLGIFLASFLIFLVLFLGTGADLLTSFSAIAATISNTGLGLGMVHESFAPISTNAKLILTLAMLAGRLEFYTILVLFTASYWRN